MCSFNKSECVVDLEFMLLDVVLNILEFIFGLCFGY